MKYLLILLIGCSILSKAYSQTPATRKTDSTQIRTTILTFYSWYTKNWEKLSRFRLYTGKNGKTDQPPYRINWKGVESYLAYMKSTIPQLGSDFIKNERAFFRDCDSAFKADTESEIPYGFDYDRFTDSQEEPQWLLDELKKPAYWEMLINKSGAEVIVHGSYEEKGRKIETVIMCFKMKKEKGKWKIAEIGCRFDPLTFDAVEK